MYAAVGILFRILLWIGQSLRGDGVAHLSEHIWINTVNLGLVAIGILFWKMSKDGKRETIPAQ